MTDLVPAATDIVCARWRTAIDTRMAPILAARPRSWDLWSDVISPAYDDVRDSIGDAIAVTVAFIEYLTDEEVSATDRKMIAAGIRANGKAFAFGLAQAVGRTEDWSMGAWFRYASSTARRVNDERRNG